MWYGWAIVCLLFTVAKYENMDFVGGKEISSTTLIVDNESVFGDPVLKCYIRQLLNAPDQNVHIYLYRHDSTDLLDKLNIHPSCKLKIHDFSRDIFGWETEANRFEFPVVSENATVFIDDLSKLIDLTDYNKVCRLLNRCNNELKKSKIVSVVRGDLHHQSTLRSLEYSCRTWIVLEASESPNVYARAVTISKKPKCSTKKSEECITITNEFEIKFEKILTISKEPQQKNEDPLNNLTFNVALKSSEVEARNNLVLPYLAAREVKINKAPAKIEYVPDEYDDFDDEDPDDDLDI